MRPTLFLTSPTPGTLDEAMTIINQLVADNKTFRKTDKAHQDKVSIFCSEHISRERTGQGKNKFKEVMNQRRDSLSTKIDEILTELISPQAHFLSDKWHIWLASE